MGQPQPDEQSQTTRREAGERLKRLAPGIVRRWERELRLAVPAARDQPPPVLLDSVPGFLERLGNALCEGCGQDLAIETGTAAEHGEQRAQVPGYTLEQVIGEYHLLQRVLLEELEAESPLASDTRLLINSGIHRAIEVAAARYARATGEAYRHVEERYRLLVESARDYALFTMDLEGRVTTWSAGAERITGYTAGEMIGQPGDLIFTEEDRQQGAPEQERETARREGRAEDERWHRRRDGSRFFASGVLTPMLDGELAGYVKVMRDVTERHRMEEALRRRDEERRQLLQREQAARAEAERERSRLHTVFMQAPALIAVTRGPEHVFEFVNSCYQEVVGRRDYLGKPAREALPELEAQGYIELLDRVYHTGEPFTGKEMPIELDRDGVKRQAFFSFVYQPIFGPDSAVEGIFGHAVEVTEEVLARGRIEAQAAERAAILGQIVDGVIITDAAGRITFVNEAARRIHGVAELGVPVERYAETYRLFKMDGQPYPSLELPLARAVLRGETVADAEWRIRCPDGSEVIAQGSAGPIVAPDGTRLGAVLLVRDVTAQRAVYRQREELLEELALANERKDEFLATLAHELRNPLAPIRTAVEVMRLRSGADPALRRAQETIERQVQQMSLLVDDLLDVARITRGKIALRKSVVDLGAVVAHAVQTARPAIDLREQHLSVSVPGTGDTGGEPVHLEADSTRLEQIITNLLTNAAKFTPPRGQIRVTAEREQEHAVVRVRDTGKGIPPEMLPHIFGLFTQVNPTIDRAEGGLGLGLTLVKSLVELHGGTVEARSEGPGRGSEFIVRLPIQRTKNEEGKTNDTPTPDAALRPSSFLPRPSLRILVVDDNLDAAETLAELLPLWGHAVEVAHGGPAALEAAAEFRPDVVLLDIGLPGMDGYEVARRLRADPATAAVRLVALTGFGQEHDRQRSAGAGFDHHLVKPVHPGELRSLLSGLRRAG